MIKNCPFCGSKPSVIKNVSHLGCTYGIKCMQCGAEGGQFYRDAKAAAKEWNKRAKQEKYSSLSVAPVLVNKSAGLPLKLRLAQEELNALKHDMDELCVDDAVLVCKFCKRSDSICKPGDECHFEWRGVCAENRGNENGTE